MIKQIYINKEQSQSVHNEEEISVNKVIEFVQRVKWGNLLFGLGLVVLIAYVVVGVGQAAIPPKEVVVKEGFEYVEVRVYAGDTAWDIQQELTPNVDVRPLLHHLKSVNNIESMSAVKAGEVYLFLKPVDEVLVFE